MSMSRFAFAAFCAIPLFACSGSSSSDAATNGDDGTPIDVNSDELRKGGVTFERPEVGLINIPQGNNLYEFCTGTLIAPHTVLTAAHCVHFYNHEDKYDVATFQLVNHSRVYTHHVTAYRSLGSGLGSHDVAVLYLRDGVPPSQAVPAPLAGGRPPLGAPVMQYGYGFATCYFNGTTRVDVPDKYRYKRRYEFAMGQNPQDACGGDSGGPVFYHGEIFAVMSATLGDQGLDDIYGHTTELNGELRSVISSWR